MTDAASGSYILGATCVAFDAQGKVLISRRRSPVRWELPGGLVEPDESFFQAAERETLEETGVAVTVRGLVGVYQHPSRRILAGLFVADHVAGEPVPTDESSAARWSVPAQALEILHPLYRPRLQDVLAADRTAVLRVHEGQNLLAMLGSVENPAPRVTAYELVRDSE